MKIVKSKRENLFNYWLTETEMWCELVRKKKTGPKESQIEWKAKALPIFISFILQRSCLLALQWRKTEFVKTSTFPVFYIYTFKMPRIECSDENDELINWSWFDPFCFENLLDSINS